MLRVIGCAALIGSLWALALPASAQPEKGKAAVNEQCCKSNNAECESRCRSADGVKQDPACWNACAGRISKCLQGGMYEWRSKPHANCKAG